MPVSYQDFVLSNQYFGTPMPTDPKMKMELTPIVYENMRTIGARPSRLQQGLRAVGRGLAIAGGAGLAVGVANSLFNKPSDNYEQSVTNNQTTGGRNTRVGQLDSFDEFFETDNEKYAKTGGLEESTPPSKSTTPAQTASITSKTDQYLAGIGPDPAGTNQYDATVGPHSLASATGIGRKPRMAKLGGSEFSQALRQQEQDANIAAFHAENEAALRGESPRAVTGAYGPQELMGQGGMSISTGEEEDYRRKTGQSLKKYGLTDRTKPERRGQFRTDLILDPDTMHEKQRREQIVYEESPANTMEAQFQARTGLDSREGREQFKEIVAKNPPTTTEKVEQFINKTKSDKNLSEKKTQKISNTGEGTPKGSKKADPLAALDQVVSEGGTSSNPVIGGLQAGIKTGRVLGSVVKRGAQDSAEALKLATQYIQNSEAMKKIQRATDTNPDISDYGLKRKMVEERRAKREMMKDLTGGFGEVNEKMYEDLKSKGLIDESE